MADCAHERQGKRDVGIALRGSSQLKSYPSRGRASAGGKELLSLAFGFDFFRCRSYLVGSYDNSSEHPTRCRGEYSLPFHSVVFQ